MLSSPPQQAVTREDIRTCLQWPDHLLLISIVISLLFFWMLPLNILSLVCSIIVSLQHCIHVSKQYLHLPIIVNNYLNLQERDIRLWYTHVYEHYSCVAD